MNPLRKLVSIRIYLLSLFEALVTAGCFVAGIYALDPIEAPLYLEYEGGAVRVAVVAIAFLLASYVMDFYKRAHVRSRVVVALQVCPLIGFILIVEAALGFVNAEVMLPQQFAVAGCLLTLIVLVLWRIFLRPTVWNAFGAQQVLFVGCNQASLRLAEAFADPATGMMVAGFLVDDVPPVLPAPVLGKTEQLRNVITSVHPDRIIVSEQSADKSLLMMLFHLKASGVTVETAGQAHESVFGRIYSHALEPYTVVFRNDLAGRPGNLALQSIYTNVLALMAVVVFLPLLILIAIALRLTGSPRVLEKFPCTGLHGVPFQMLRFHCHGPVGRFLNRFHLEGLPRIINLLRGEMSLIGPRPEKVWFDRRLARLLPFYPQRYHVKPGLIGWSQLNCDPSMAEDALAHLEYDLFYIKHISLVLDIYILLRAIKWMVQVMKLNDADQADEYYGARVTETSIR
jgi:lipopolysaccharide/colanic/teichoic acid biosynthesis glycosyltransferase